MDSKEYLKDWLIGLLSGLVQYPSDVNVEVKTDEMGVLFTLFCNQSDKGRVIGRGGKTADAIRTILRVAGISRNVRASLKIPDEKVA